MSLKNKIRNKIALAVNQGMSLEEASFRVRQWARRKAAQDRLKAKREEEENKPEPETNNAKKKKISGSADKRSKPSG